MENKSAKSFVYMYLESSNFLRNNFSYGVNGSASTFKGFYVGIIRFLVVF